ncbi:ABC transporter, ATP-binding protein [Teladorsagia circumcincta]|uniref:ABC-type xenobiotic transporter n=2 Tax=Teladorsagia circumcincta TaxID=45464 RepID=A0A2G9UKR0_TELCI|nr:ABC transporter, ATP-binding protein [Teladorsagia circumcincta]
MFGKDKDEERIPLIGTSRKSSISSIAKGEEPPIILKDGILSLATPVDYVFLVAGTLASFIHGAGFSVLGIVLGGMTTVFLRAQNSEFVLGTVIRDPKGLPGISKEDFDDQVTMYCFYYLGLGFAMFATSYIQIVCWETFAERITHKLRQIYLKAILRQQISWFDAQQTGNLTARLTDDLERVREGLGDKLSLFIQMVSAFVAGFGVGFAYSWSMTLVMMAVAPFIVFSASWMSKIVATRTQVEQETYAVAGAIAEETFSSIRTVHALCGHRRELTRFEAALEKGRKTGLVKYFYMGVGVGFGQMCTYVSYALAFWYGSTLIISDPTLDRGRIFTVFFAVMSGSSALGTCLPYLNTISIAQGAVRSVLKVINSRPKIDPYSLDGIVLNNMRGSIRLKNVHFSYPSRSTLPILRGVSLQVAAGQKIALVGSSGCGKSTIVNLLLRFYDPTRGKVTIDDIDVCDLNVHKLREQIGVVSQEPVLFDGTLFENIRMGYENATMEEVQEACRIANAADFIKRLPDGYGTRVGERGVQLSGGQKQRIAIARAIIKNPRILLLDEATSALDTEAESIVQEALEKAQKGRTTVIVAHRLSTIRNVDQIFVFKNGEIVEQGTHAELINKRGAFFEMTQAQVLRQEKEEEVPENKELVENSQETPSRVPKVTVSIPSQERTKPSSPSDSDAESDVLSPDLSLSRFDTLRSRKASTRSAVSIVTSVRSMQLDMENLRAKPTPMSKLFYFNRDKWGFFALGLIACIVTGTVTPVFAVLYAQIIQVYSEPVDQMKSDVMFWCGAFIVIGLVHAFAFFFSAICLGRCGESLTKKLRFEAFKNLLRQDVGFYDDIRHGTGKLCTRFATDAPNVRYVFTRLPGVISSAVTIVGALVIGFVFGWQLALILIVMVPLIIGSGYFEMQMQFGKKMRDTELLEEAGKVASQAVENIRTVHALNRQEQFHFMYCEYLKEPHRENLCQTHTYGGVFAFSQSLLFFMYAIAFWIGAIFVDNHSMQPIDVYRVFFAFMFCGQMVGNISSFIPDVVKARLAASLLFYLIEHPTEIDNLSEDGIKKKLCGHVVFRNVYFNYPTRKQIRVLRGLSLEIQPGTTVALVGRSGCGKSTVMALLERFYNQSRGIITVDGENIRNMNIRDLREQVCIVSQEPTLFDCTILENICYGLDDPKPSYEKVVAAAKMANIHNFVLGLPEGYDTRVGEKGTQLSGGQKQRIAIARALIRDPPILLLDEATSALDTESEKIVQDALEVARQGRTCIVIAHRLSTIQDSDVIVMVQEGKATDKGTHEHLLLKNELYQRLCETQRLVESQ